MYMTHYVPDCSSGKPFYVSYFNDNGKGPDYGCFKTYDEAEACRIHHEETEKYIMPTCSLDNLECKTPYKAEYYKDVPCAVPCCPTVIKKKESTMRESYIENNINATERPSDLSRAREALVENLRDVRDTKRAALRGTFFLDAPETPKTATEAIARIKAGQFQPVDKAKDEAKAEANYSYSWYRAIDWRTQPKDEVGYDAAIEKLTAAYADAKLTIQVLPEVEGLKAFKDFQSFSPVTLN